jgi:hypothetical protein
VFPLTTGLDEAMFSRERSADAGTTVWVAVAIGTDEMVASAATLSTSDSDLRSMIFLLAPVRTHLR